MRPVANRNAVLVLALLSIIWSYNWVVMKQVLQWSGPFEFAAWRSALGALVLVGLLAAKNAHRTEGRACCAPADRNFTVYSRVGFIDIEAIMVRIIGGDGGLAQVEPSWCAASLHLGSSLANRMRWLSGQF